MHFIVEKNSVDCNICLKTVVNCRVYYSWRTVVIFFTCTGPFSSKNAEIILVFLSARRNRSNRLSTTICCIFPYQSFTGSRKQWKNGRENTRDPALWDTNDKCVNLILKLFHWMTDTFISFVRVLNYFLFYCRSELCELPKNLSYSL